MVLGIPNPAREALASTGEANRIVAASRSLQPVSRALQHRVGCGALTSDARMAAGPAREAHQRNISLPREAFETEFAGVLNRNAYDEENTDAQV